MLQEIAHWGNDERSSWEARAWHRNKRYKDRLLPYSRFHGGAIPPICKGNKREAMRATLDETARWASRVIERTKTDPPDSIRYLTTE